MHQMRAVSLSSYLEVAASVGLDGQRLLRQAGISPETLADPEQRLPARVAIGLVDRSAELSGCESFGLQMAAARTSPAWARSACCSSACPTCAR